MRAPGPRSSRPVRTCTRWPEAVSFCRAITHTLIRQSCTRPQLVYLTVDEDAGFPVSCSRPRQGRARGLDLNQRPLGYEGVFAHDPHQRPATSPKESQRFHAIRFGPGWLGWGPFPGNSRGESGSSPDVSSSPKPDLSEGVAKLAALHTTVSDTRRVAPIKPAQDTAAGS